MKNKPVVAISGCLVGEQVRYNKQHKKSPSVTGELSDYFEYQSFCPEMSMGLGVPRAPIKLVKKGESICLVNSKDISIDHTQLAKKTFEKIDKEIEVVSGIIFASRSPTCGLAPANVVDFLSGKVVTNSKGLWAHHLEEKYPLIPKISSGKLYDDELRDTFRTQVVIYNEYMTKVSMPKDLINFHEVYKYYFMQYGATHLKKLGQICAGVSNSNISLKLKDYKEYLFGTLFDEKITCKNRTNVFQHLAGYFKSNLGTSDKKYLDENIKAFYTQKISFATLLTLLEFLSRSYNQSYLKKQRIFNLYSQRSYN
jgi:uncharacterized protein YbbK (DUF523 family)/uncharacterized protein YbgA (DUF1722 family)